MFVGVISLLKDPVETVRIEAHDADMATAILADYVYRNYNSQIPPGGYYYDGVVIDTSKLSTIGVSSLETLQYS